MTTRNCSFGAAARAPFLVRTSEFGYSALTCTDVDTNNKRSFQQKNKEQKGFIHVLNTHMQAHARYTICLMCVIAIRVIQKRMKGNRSFYFYFRQRKVIITVCSECSDSRNAGKLVLANDSTVMACHTLLVYSV